jgi:hypothetical protein
MLMKLLSLAISLVSVQTLFPAPQQTVDSNQISQTQRVQQNPKTSSDSTYVINLPGRISVNPIPLPEGDRAWAVQIVTTGGFTGKGRGNVTLTSDGTIQRFGPDGSCSIKLPDDTMKALTETVFAANSTYNTDGSVDRQICADCIVTALVVTRRKSGGDETLASSWDDATQAKVAADLLNIYQAVMANKDCKLQ